MSKSLSHRHVQKRKKSIKKGLFALTATAVLTSGIPLSSMAAPDHAKKPAEPFSFNVASDIQGDLRDFEHTLQDIETFNPDSKALVINGDITDRGWDFEYEAVQNILDRNEHPENLWYTIGNHEFYKPKWASPTQLAQNTWPNNTPESELFQNFYDFSGEDSVYYKKELEGYPFLFLGTEKYMKYHDDNLWDQVYLSDEQLSFLKENLEHYTKKNKNKPIFLFSHHTLKDTVSGTDMPLYSNDYLQEEELLDILKDYPQVILFTSHTHQDLNNPDWAGKKVVEGGDKQGFTVVNTGTMQTVYTDNGSGGEKPVYDTTNQSLQVSVDKNNVKIQAMDFGQDRVIKELSVKNNKISQLAPNVEADDEKNVLVGATEHMEYSVKGKNEWMSYDPANPPVFSGNQVVWVRHKGEMNLESGTPQKVKFKKN